MLEILKMTFGATAMKKTSVYDWHRRFEVRHEDVADDERVGHILT